MQIFGQNFWMWSFAKGKPNFVAMLVPAVAWAALFMLPLTVYQWRQQQSPGALLQALPKGSVLRLAVIGLLDSLGGLTSIYSVMHVPVLLQTILYSIGPLWTYLVASVAYPASVRPLNRWLALVVVCAGGAIALAAVPQMNQGGGSNLNVAWIGIFLLTCILPPTYNVVQGRFLADFQGSPAQGKLVVLAGDCAFQVLFTLCYFPLDAVPWFGSSRSLADSWTGTADALSCISSCENNASYMIIYIVGFWVNHVVFAYLNVYSPTIGALLSQLSGPINTFLLAVFPAWNIYGAPVALGYAMGSFALLTLAVATYSVWHIGTPPPIAVYQPPPGRQGYSACSVNDQPPGAETDVACPSR
jgi:hypothetical protein